MFEHFKDFMVSNWLESIHPEYVYPNERWENLFSWTKEIFSINFDNFTCFHTSSCYDVSFLTTRDFNKFQYMECIQVVKLGYVHRYISKLQYRINSFQELFMPMIIATMPMYCYSFNCYVWWTVSFFCPFLCFHIQRH